MNAIVTRCCTFYAFRRLWLLSPQCIQYLVILDEPLQNLYIIRSENASAFFSLLVYIFSVWWALMKPISFKFFSLFSVKLSLNNHLNSRSSPFGFDRAAIYKIERRPYGSVRYVGQYRRAFSTIYLPWSNWEVIEWKFLTDPSDPSSYCFVAIWRIDTFSWVTDLTFDRLEGVVSTPLVLVTAAAFKLLGIRESREGLNKNP